MFYHIIRLHTIFAGTKAPDGWSRAKRVWISRCSFHRKCPTGASKNGRSWPMKKHQKWGFNNIQHVEKAGFQGFHRWVHWKSTDFLSICNYDKERDFDDLAGKTGGWTVWLTWGFKNLPEKRWDFTHRFFVEVLRIVALKTDHLDIDISGETGIQERTPGPENSSCGMFYSKHFKTSIPMFSVQMIDSRWVSLQMGYLQFEGILITFPI